jgi:Zn-dependent M16 (insulinase) family peptidase
MHGLYREFDARINGFNEFARDLIARTVVKAGAYVSITASEPADISGLTALLQEGTARPASVSYTSPLPAKLGLQVPASVSHAVRAYDLSKTDMKPAGSMSVAANILSLAYLWNEIRVKGGAYGTSVNASRTGSYLCYSYRDPSPEKSLNT